MFDCFAYVDQHVKNFACFIRLNDISRMIINSPTEALRQLSASVHGPEERRVPVTAEAHEELLALLDALQAWHSVGAAGD